MTEIKNKHIGIGSMRILIIGLTIMALFQVGINLAYAAPVDVEDCNCADDVKCLLKFYKPCQGGWCLK